MAFDFSKGEQTGFDFSKGDVAQGVTKPHDWGTSPAEVRTAGYYLNKGLGVLGSIGQGIKEFTSGSTGRAVGGLIAGGIGSAVNVAGAATGNQKMMETGTKIQKEGEKGLTPGNIGMTAVELFPGGGESKGVVKTAEEAAAAGLKKSAVKEYVQALNPTKEAMKRQAEKYAPEAIKRGVVFKDTQQLAEKAAGKVEVAGEKIGEMWDKVSPELKTKAQPVIDALDKGKEAFMAEGKVLNQSAVDAFDKVKNVVTQFGEDISAKTFRKMRQVFDAAKDFTKTEETAFKDKAEKVAGNAIREELGKAVPEVKKLNAEFTFWQAMKDVAEASRQRKLGQKGALKVLGGVAGAVTGAQQGHGVQGKIEQASLDAFLGATAVDFITGPAFKSVSAVAKDRLADFIVKGRYKDALALLARAGMDIKHSTENK